MKGGRRQPFGPPKGTLSSNWGVVEKAYLTHACSKKREQKISDHITFTRAK